MDQTIVFIGGGNMTRAIVGGLLKTGYAAAAITVTNRSTDKLTYFSQQCGVNTSADNVAPILQADVVVLAVKPQQMHALCDDIAAAVAKRRPLVISIAAGVASASLQAWLGEPCAIVRALPNTPAMVCAGATGLFANDQVSAEQRTLAESLFRAVGIALWLTDEAQMPAVVAVSGSGPAYVFLLLEALQAEAQQMGLSAEHAQQLAEQMVLGAARMAMETDQSAADLRAAVTSPQGTTAAALAVFESGGFRRLVADAMQAAHDRAQQLTELLS